MEKEITKDNFNIEEELVRFNTLENEVNETIKMLNDIIEMFNNRNEIAKGMSSRIVALVEQKIGLLMRKESIIKNIADLKKNAFTINQKIKETESGEEQEFSKIMAQYTAAIREQQKELNQAKDEIRQVLNKEETDAFFGKHN